MRETKQSFSIEVEGMKAVCPLVVIDGCFMRCHGRIMKNIVGDEKMIQFDVLAMYNKGNKYADLMLVDEVNRELIDFLPADRD